jgi:hypothetical protein
MHSTVQRLQEVADQIGKQKIGEISYCERVRNVTSVCAVSNSRFYVTSRLISRLQSYHSVCT